MIRCHSKRRGSLMLGMAAIGVVLAALTASVLQTSLQSYHASAQGEWRLRSLAAAEGAALLVRDHPLAEREPVIIGGTRVHFSGGGEAPELRTEVLSPQGKVVFEGRYQLIEQGNNVRLKRIP